MVRALALVVAVGCGPTGSDRTDDDAGTDDGTTDPWPTGMDDTDPANTTACVEQEGLTITSFEATAAEPFTNVELHIGVSAPATVAARCVSDTEPDQIFFAEGTVAATEHTVRLSGLLPNMDWTCTAAPTCPTAAGAPASTSYHTAVPPSGLRAFTVDVDPTLGMTGAWTLAPFSLTQSFGDTWIVIWGPDGRVRWWMPLPEGPGIWLEARFHEEDDAIVWGGGNDPQGRVRVVDLWDGETYAWAPVGWQDVIFHHDGKRIDDGRLMTLETRDNSDGNEDFVGFGLRVHDPVTGSVDFEFDSQVLVDEGILGAGDDIDPWHANWMDWHESAEGPKVYVSLCDTMQILAIDATSGELDWQLGEDLGWTVRDTAGAELPQSQLPGCQHGLEVLGDDRLLVYDNGQNKASSEAQEWLIDGDTNTATLLWRWTEDGWYTPYVGDIDDLGNDRVLLTQAPGPVVEVDRATGLVANRMSFLDGGLTYRAERYDGCALFSSVKDCADIAARYCEIEPLLTP